MHIRVAWTFVKAPVESKNPAHHYSERGSPWSCRELNPFLTFLQNLFLPAFLLVVLGFCQKLIRYLLGSFGVFWGLLSWKCRGIVVGPSPALPGVGF
ncbi:hypothetical protein ACQXX0_02035 [Corynebacterium diphtheriae]